MKKMFLMILAAAGLVAASCSKDNSSPGDYTGPDGKGSITVTIRGESSPGRAIGDPTPEQEKTVKSFTVYVFNYPTGVLEKTQTFTNVLSGEIKDLNAASQKRVVVFVNEPEGYNPSIGNYDDFYSPANLLALDSQVPGDFDTQGLFMSGQALGPVILNVGEENPVTVRVKRLTSKIKLGKVTVSPESGLSLSDFELTGVSVQRTPDKAPGMGGIATSGSSYIGGLSISGAVSNPHLYNILSLPGGYQSGDIYEPKAYYYVFPNNDTQGEATLLSVHGKYQGTQMYYSFYINDKASSSGGSSTDGKFIESNKIYTLNVTLKKIGNGGDSPDVPSEAADMTVTVDVADWDNELVQEVEW